MDRLKIKGKEREREKRKSVSIIPVAKMQQSSLDWIFLMLAVCHLGKLLGQACVLLSKRERESEEEEEREEE